MYLIIDIRMIIESRIACEGNLSSIDYDARTPIFISGQES